MEAIFQKKLYFLNAILAGLTSTKQSWNSKRMSFPGIVGSSEEADLTVFLTMNSAVGHEAA